MYLIPFALATLPLALAAMIPPVDPAITPAPIRPRQASTSPPPITSCALSDGPAITLQGVVYPATTLCSCNGGQMAQASFTIGKDASTTWSCMAGTPPLVVSTQPPMPTPTWYVRVEVGKTNFMVGDYDQSGFEALMRSPCNANGCDGGTPQSFKFNWTEPTGAGLIATGDVTMAGNIDKNQNIEQGLLDSLNAALLKTSNCTQQETTFGNKEGGPLEPQTLLLPQCRVSSYLQATLYNGPDSGTASVMAQMTFQGSSQNPGPLLCQEILGDINLGLGFVKIPDPVSGAIAVAQAFCGGGS